jgi:hypothetical protein
VVAARWITIMRGHAIGPGGPEVTKHKTYKTNQAPVWRAVHDAMPKRMPPTPAAAWSSPRSTPGASRSRSSDVVISGRSVHKRPDDRPPSHKGWPGLEEAKMNTVLVTEILETAAAQK